MRSFVIGGAGFIGSHLVEPIAARGQVTVFDNLSVGRREFLAAPIAAGAVQLVVGDGLDLESLAAAMQGHDIVFHLAANPEARWGLQRTRLDLEQGTIATWNALEAARRAGVTKFVLASSGTVYGDVAQPCGEMDLGHLPISLYGASKLACESLVSAFVECFGLQGFICRFGNVVGPRSTHGVILDLCKKLRDRPGVLEVLGDGRQAKPYLHVTDCVRGILHIIDHAPDRLNVFNIGPADVTSVRWIAERVVAAAPGGQARVEFTGGHQGWPGDIAVSRLRPDKLAALGFQVGGSSDDAVARAVTEIAAEVFGAVRA